MKRAAIGVSAHLGWAATATVALERGRVRVLRSDRLETAKPGDRDAAEPFHVAGGFEGLSRVPQPRDPGAALRRGLEKQRRYTTRQLAKLVRALAELDHEIAVGAILVSRGRSAPSLEKQIGSHTQIHIEEGNAVRDSIARALRAAGAQVVELDAKSLLDVAAERLGAGAPELMKQLEPLRPENAGAWRVEERRAALAAWVACAPSRGRRTH